MSMWVIRNAYVPAVTFTSVVTYFEGGDVPAQGVVDKVAASVPVDFGSPVVIATLLADAAIQANFQAHVAAAGLSNV